MQAVARRSMLTLVVIALIGGAAGLRAEDRLVSPESVGFSSDGLKTFQRTMRALVDESQARRCHDARRPTRQGRPRRRIRRPGSGDQEAGHQRTRSSASRR